MMLNQDLEVKEYTREYPLSYYLSLKYHIAIYPEERGFSIMIPDLPGCMSQGRTLEEAMANIYQAKHLWLETVYVQGKDAIPLPSSLAKAFVSDYLRDF